MSDRSDNDPVFQFSASLKNLMTKADIEVPALSQATAIPVTRLQEILDHPGSVRLAEIMTIALYFGMSLSSFFG